MPRSPKKPRRLVADGRTYLWSLRHRHDDSGPTRDDAGWTVGCVHTLTLTPQPAGTGGPLRIVFASGPGRYVPGGAPFGSGDVGYGRDVSLNLHEPGAVRALLDAAAARGWLPGPDEPGVVEVDGWALLEEAAASRGGSGSEDGSGGVLRGRSG
ncbi:hypothetical protein [Streptomyces sp. NPDC050528]|uniref:hypothetical protein n=1 Tax=Streptomyces sp. NPDC050528 TaxID=3365623 RepID=UPI0037B5B5DF